MNCLSVRNHLFSFHENRLSEEENYALAEHLKSCSDCLAISVGAKSMDELIRQKKSEQPNPFIHTRTIQRIESETGRSAAWYMPVKNRILNPIMFSVLLLIGIGSGSFTGWKIYYKTVSNAEHQKELESIRSGLSIDDFIDEGHLFLTNKSE